MIIGWLVMNMMTDQIYIWTYVRNGVLKHPLLMLGYDSAIDFIHNTGCEFIKSIGSCSLYKANDFYYAWIPLCGNSTIVKVPDDMLEDFENFIISSE